MSRSTWPAPSPFLRCWGAVLGACWVMGPASIGWAAPFELHLSSAQCGTELALRQRVERRLLQPPPRGWRFAVGVISRQHEVRVEIRSTSPGGRSEIRTVGGSRCESVMDAAALIMAVMLDPTLQQPAPAQRPGPGARASSSRTLATPVRPAAWRLGLVGSAGTRSGLDSGLALDLTAGFAVQAPNPWRTQATLRFVRGQGGAQGAGQTARLALNAGRASLLPARWQATPWLSMGPCASLEVGYLQGQLEQGEGVPGGGLWLAGLLELPVTFELERAGLSVVPFGTRVLKQHGFVVRGDPLYEVPLWELGGRLELRVWLL